MQFELLPGLPATGPVPEQFSALGRGTFRKGLVVRFVPEGHSPWVGNFQPGIGRFTGVVEHPNRSDLVVVSGGQAFVVKPQSRDTEVLASGAIRSVIEIDSPRLLVFDHHGIRFEAFDAAGLRWRTRQVSWDGFQNVSRLGNALVGEAWNALSESWQPFSVSLDTGATIGESFTTFEPDRWEQLHVSSPAS